MVAGMDDLKMKYKKINTRNMNSMDELFFIYELFMNYKDMVFKYT